MDDITANRIVFFILLLIVLGIVSAIHILVTPYGSFVYQLKNNAGNYSTSNMLMMVAAAVGLYLLFVFLFTPRQDPALSRHPKRG